MPKSSAPKKVISENRESSIKFYVGLLGMTVLVVIGAVLLGKSDQGEIDVNAAIINSNQTMKESGEPVEEVNTIPKRLRDLPNGGLVPSNTPVEETPTQTETPEEQTSSTTTDDAEEESEGDEATEEETQTDDEASEEEGSPTDEPENAPVEEAQTTEATQE